MNMKRIYIIMAAAIAFLAAESASAQSKSFKLGQWSEIHNSIIRELNASYVDSLPVDRIMRAGIDAMLEELDPYTIYTVKGDDGTTVFYGENQATIPTGQIPTVNDVVASVDDIPEIKPYDTYLIGTDATGYRVSCFTLNKTMDGFDENSIEFDDRYGVRIRSKGLKNYVIVNGRLRSYDDVDCGPF